MGNTEVRGQGQFARMEPRAFYTEWLRMVARQEDELAEDRRFVEAAQISR